MLGRFYNHDVRHYRFVRSLQEHQPIEECEVSSWAFRLWLVTAVVAAVGAVLVLW